MSNAGFLDIWVEGGDRPVKLRTRGPDACWVDLTPEQAIDVATELLNCVRSIRLPQVIPAAMPRPLLTTAAPVTPRRKIRNGRARKLQVSGDDKPPPKFSAAAQWLKSMLATGPVPVGNLKQEADAAGHTWATVPEEETMTNPYYPSPEASIATHRIEADSQTLFRQAPMTAHTYLLCAIHDIDEVLGKGYAKAHPELIAAYMQTAAFDMGAAVIARAVEALGDAVEFALRPEELHPEPIDPPSNRRAGDELGVTSEVDGFEGGWAWRLPGDLLQDHEQEHG